jgi:hypothetical protein
MNAGRRTLFVAGAVATALVVTTVAGHASPPELPTSSPRQASRAAAAADRADSIAAARAASVERPGRWLREALPAGDVDWFHFRLASATAVSVTLGGLPADYDLTLYDDSGRQRATSQRTGTTVDEAWVKMPTGDVLVRVTRKRGAAAGTYSLRLRTFSPGVHMLSSRRTSTRGEVIGEFYNATGQWHAVSELNAVWLDRKGRAVHRLTTFMSPNTYVRPWSRVPFTVGDQITGAQDARTVTIRVTARLVTEDVPPKLAPLSARITRTVTRKPTATEPGARTYHGKVSTTSRGRVAKVQVYVCEYNAYGTLQTLGMTDRDYTLPARGSRSWFGESRGSWAKPSLVTVRAYENMNG